MKFFNENPPKAVFWYGFSFVCVFLLAGMGYFAYMIATEKPKVVETKKEDLATRVYTNVSAAKANSTASGKIAAIDEKSLTIPVDGKDKEFALTDNTIYVTGPSQESGKKEDLKVGMSISFTYNVNTNTAINVNY